MKFGCFTSACVARSGFYPKPFFPAKKRAQTHSVACLSNVSSLLKDPNYVKSETTRYSGYYDSPMWHCCITCVDACTFRWSHFRHLSHRHSFFCKSIKPPIAHKNRQLRCMLRTTRPLPEKKKPLSIADISSISRTKVDSGLDQRRALRQASITCHGFNIDACIDWQARDVAVPRVSQQLVDDGASLSVVSSGKDSEPSADESVRRLRERRLPYLSGGRATIVWNVT